MKPIFKYNQQKNITNPKYFSSCCPHQPLDNLPATQISFKKPRKFITLSKNISTERQPTDLSNVLKTPKAKKVMVASKPPETQFQEDKFSFLHQIRKFNPQSQEKQPEPQQPTFTLDSSKENNSSGKSNENNLNNLLDSINNEMFSNLLVSSSIKQKIVVSASLRSISEVRSQLQISQRSESYLNSLVNTQR